MRLGPTVVLVLLVLVGMAAVDARDAGVGAVQTATTADGMEPCPGCPESGKPCFKASCAKPALTSPPTAADLPAAGRWARIAHTGPDDAMSRPEPPPPKARLRATV